MRWLMPIEEILDMEANDSEGSLGYEGATVREILKIKELDEYHERIRKVMEREQINLVPVAVFGDLFMDGLHRVRIAVELDLDVMLVTDDLSDSGWHDDRSYEVIGE